MSDSPPQRRRRARTRLTRPRTEPVDGAALARAHPRGAAPRRRGGGAARAVQRSLAARQRRGRARRATWRAACASCATRRSSPPRKDLPTVFQEMGLVRAVLERARAGRRSRTRRALLRPPARPGGRRRSRDYCLGRHTFVDREAGVRVVDWRYAPVAAHLLPVPRGRGVRGAAARAASPRGVVDGAAGGGGRARASSARISAGAAARWRAAPTAAGGARAREAAGAGRRRRARRRARASLGIGRGARGRAAAPRR